jgi:sRNA-binding carbon storage regulator CsrA
MLVISRKENEVISIEPAAGLDPSLTLRDAFSRGPIVVRLVQVGGRRVRLAIDGPPELRVWRGPCPNDSEGEDPSGATR